MIDDDEERIRKFILSSKEPRETIEIENKFNISHSKAMLRLLVLASKHQIGSKKMGSGKGTWIWFRKYD